MRPAYSRGRRWAVPMDRGNLNLLLLVGFGGLAYWIWQQTQQPAGDNPPPSDATSFGNNPAAAITELVTPWKSAGQAAVWLGPLAAAEQAYSIPTDLLARIAYQESRFRQDIIDGTTASSAGALGMMQLMPQYFTSVQVPLPFSDNDTSAQIEQAAAFLASNFQQLGTWQLAVAAYNAGVARVRKSIPTSTQTYVAQIIADVPGLA